MTVALAAVGDLLDVPVETADSRVVIDDVVHDSRRAVQSCLFACIPGSRTDGHDHAADAVEAGATALLAERSLGLGVPELIVAHVRSAVGPVAALVHDNPSRHLDLVGVTGTNGKTTTVRIVASMMGSLGVAAREIGTLTGVRTTPEAPELQRQLAAARRTGDRVVAMEVSSHALDQHRVDGCRFAVVAFTNLGMDHLDHHGTMEEYYEAKRRLFSPEKADLAVIDTRSAYGARLADESEIPVVRIEPDDVTGESSGATASRFVWRGQAVDLPLGGAFNVANAVLAAEVAVALGHDPARIARALAETPQVPGRFESVDEGQPFTVIVDYAHTPDGLEAVLDAARRVTRRSLVVVFGAGGNRDHGKRPHMGEVVRRLADRVVVTNDNPRGEDPDKIISGIVSGMATAPDLVESDRRAAIRHAIAGARDGDVVLIAGKGHETTQTIGADVSHFDDAEVAREELRRLAGAAS